MDRVMRYRGKGPPPSSLVPAIMTPTFEAMLVRNGAPIIISLLSWLTPTFSNGNQLARGSESCQPRPLHSAALLLLTSRSMILLGRLSSFESQLVQRSYEPRVRCHAHVGGVEGLMIDRVQIILPLHYYESLSIEARLGACR